MAVFHKLSFISPAAFQNFCLWCQRTAWAVPPPCQRTQLSGFGFWCPRPDMCQSEASVQRSDSRSPLVSRRPPSGHFSHQFSPGNIPLSLSGLYSLGAGKYHVIVWPCVALLARVLQACIWTWSSVFPTKKVAKGNARWVKWHLKPSDIQKPLGYHQSGWRLNVSH